MTTSTVTASESTTFIPEPGLPWLRTDPTMQHREAFTDTCRLHLQAEYTVMAPTLPGGTEVLLTRVRGLEGLVAGGLYYMSEHGGQGGFGINPPRDMGRLVAINRPRAHRTHPFAELELRYDNPAVEVGRYLNEQGHFYWMAHFNGYRSRYMQQAQPSYEFQLWRVTHYITPPLGPELLAAHLTEAGLSPAQQRWYDEEQRLWLHEAELVTAYSTGLDYPPTLEQLLDKEQAYLLQQFLQTVTPLPRSRAQRRKSPVVALTRRTHAGGSNTCFYAQEAIAPALELLEGLRRARAGREALVQHVARQHVAQDIAAHRLALAA